MVLNNFDIFSSSTLHPVFQSSQALHPKMNKTLTYLWQLTNLAINNFLQFFRHYLFVWLESSRSSGGSPRRTWCWNSGLDYRFRTTGLGLEWLKRIIIIGLVVGHCNGSLVIFVNLSATFGWFLSNWSMQSHIIAKFRARLKNT